MYSYAVRHWAKPADPNIVNAAGLTPLTLATKLGRKDIFEEMLELMKVVCTIMGYTELMLFDFSSFELRKFSGILEI